jgi:hypothetical protein
LFRDPNQIEFGVEPVEDTGDGELFLPGAELDEGVVGQGLVGLVLAGGGLHGGRHGEPLGGHPRGSP